MMKKKPLDRLAIGDVLHSMDRFFQNTFDHMQTSRHIVLEQFEAKDAYLIEAELPGVKLSHIELDCWNEYITIRVTGGTRFNQSERTVRLPFIVHADDMSAALTDGILTITISMKKSRVQINGEEVT
ncbi:Hsp20/alpha crystallin family protein [Paenalkalicoccus suaedae]|uniref:Hsp20/alpha crystallin family protein n=1 Tax=Paenalkalicoccus suaedae TaxID=2592382 RepID=A0A859FF44_9BACI|nr:Hsp20/alpha crystallin family protein [Paenalkalicoccus suaedae]QKS71591.1 Hsp20/alpha crystallin family protein [Paenalkalicoccus suaedae]